MALVPADLTRAQDLYHRVFVTGGTGNTLVQEELLNLIAATEDPTSVPFWVEVLDLSRPRDAFAGKRRTLALAALARLAIRRNAPAAYAALRDAAHHVRPEVRALAVHYLGRAYLDAERPLPPEVLDYLLNKYTDHGVAQLTDLHILELPDVPVRGTVIEIADLFGGAEELKDATRHLQDLIYAA